MTKEHRKQQVVSLQQGLDALARLNNKGHTGRVLAEELFRAGELTYERLDFIENAPYGVSYEAWKARI